jgi:hypothetical protein
MLNRCKTFVLIIIALSIMFSAASCSFLDNITSPQEIPALSPSPVEEPPKPDPIPEPSPEPVKLVEYTGPKYHIFFHSLIAFPEIAYSSVGKGTFDIDCITPLEFKRALNELYRNNYILIDINSTYEIVQQNRKELTKDKKLMLPKGKKPLIMSVDDMVYDPKKKGLGMVDKIILDKNGNFAAYTKHKDGKEVISYDNEIIPLLEQFVKDHPDFSFNGAKATLALTGWVGILGYRIDRLSPNRQNEIKAVTPIVEKLKASGWSFASHGYGHRHSSEISYNLFKDDTIKWHKEIEPIVGPTRIYVYPYGDKLSTSDAKYKLLLEYGFKIMCGVGASPVWKNYNNSIFMDRQVIDGYSLRHYRKALLPLLDTKSVFDEEGRTSW